MSTDLTLRDTRLLDAASNNLSGLEIEEKFGIPAAEAISRIRRLLTERDIWTDIERKQLLLHSAFQLKGRIEAASVDVSDPKQIDVYLKLLKTVGELLDKQSGITDKELEVVTAAQSKAMLNLIDSAFGKAREILKADFPNAYEQVDAAFAQGLREAVLEID